MIQRFVPVSEGSDRFLFPNWLFTAFARATLRTLNAGPVRVDKLSRFVAREVRRNEGASFVYDRLEKRSRSVVIGIISDVLKRLSFIQNRDGDFSLTDYQRRSSGPGSMSRDAASLTYEEYLRMAMLRPVRYALRRELVETVTPDEFFKKRRRPREARPLRSSGPVETRRLETAVESVELSIGEVAKRQRYAIHRIFFVTNRLANIGVFGKQRSSRTAALSYGDVEISIPDIHVPGGFERPWGFMRLELREDPELHIVIDNSSLRTFAKSKFLDDVSSIASDKRRSESAALIFVHGYNMTFDAALRRTAQLANDLDFRGPAISFSWPSGANLLHYIIDSNNARVAGKRLAEVISDLKTNGVASVHIVSHSMGVEVLIEATRTIAKLAQLGAVGHLAIAAPDTDSDFFEQRSRDICEVMGKVVLYASRNDSALDASMTANGFPRAGDANDILICDDIETVDATEAQTDFLGHGYFASDKRLLDDIRLAFAGVDASKRPTIEPVLNGLARYWRIPARV